MIDYKKGKRKMSLYLTEIKFNCYLDRDVTEEAGLSISEMSDHVQEALLAKKKEFPRAEVTCKVLNPEGDWTGYTLEAATEGNVVLYSMGSLDHLPLFRHQ